MASKSLHARILTKEEMYSLIGGLSVLATRSQIGLQKLAFFRVCACCGVRASEIAGMTVQDVIPFGPSPELDLPSTITKGGVRRSVPLTWDSGTRDDITRWWNHRKDAGRNAPFFHSVYRPDLPISRQTVYNWWKKIIRNLGAERSRQIGGPHSGRHTFCTHALAGGRSLGEVRDAAGHASIETTNIYVHAMPTRHNRDLWKRPPLQKIYEDEDQKNEEYYKLKRRFLTSKRF